MKETQSNGDRERVCVKKISRELRWINKVSEKMEKCVALDECDRNCERRRGNKEEITFQRSKKEKL